MIVLAILATLGALTAIGILGLVIIGAILLRPGARTVDDPPTEPRRYWGPPA